MKATREDQMVGVRAILLAMNVPLCTVIAQKTGKIFAQWNISGNSRALFRLEANPLALYDQAILSCLLVGNSFTTEPCQQAADIGEVVAITTGNLSRRPSLLFEGHHLLQGLIRDLPWQLAKGRDIRFQKLLDIYPPAWRRGGLELRDDQTMLASELSGSDLTDLVKVGLLTDKHLMIRGEEQRWAVKRL
ncbi:MAG: hypothetical protein ACK4HB_00975 [Candidatus Bipolaricaulia bacterium]